MGPAGRTLDMGHYPWLGPPMSWASSLPHPRNLECRGLGGAVSALLTDSPGPYPGPHCSQGQLDTLAGQKYSVLRMPRLPLLLLAWTLLGY